MVDVAELLVKVGFCKTKSEARRHIEGGAIKLHNTKVTDPFAQLGIVDNKWVLVER